MIIIDSIVDVVEGQFIYIGGGIFEEPVFWGDWSFYNNALEEINI